MVRLAKCALRNCDALIFFFQNKNHNYTPYIMVSNKNSFSKLTKCPERKMWAITKESFFSLSILIHKKVLPTHGLNHSQVQGKKCLKANWIQSITIICTNFSSKTHAHLQHKKKWKIRLSSTTFLLFNLEFRFTWKNLLKKSFFLEPIWY